MIIFSTFLLCQDGVPKKEPPKEKPKTRSILIENVEQQLQEIDSLTVKLNKLIEKVDTTQQAKK